MTHRLPVIAPECCTLYDRRPLWGRAYRVVCSIYDLKYPYLHLPYEAGTIDEPWGGMTITRVFFDRRQYPELYRKRIKSVDLERDGDSVWWWVVEIAEGSTFHSEATKQKWSDGKKGIAVLHKRRESKTVDGVELWICGTCKQFFPKDGFYQTKQTVLGIKSECRKCHSQSARRTRDKDLECKVRREGMLRARERDPDKFKARAKQQRQNHTRTYKDRARGKFEKAVLSGRLVRPSLCEDCGQEGKIHGHHEDYLKPLDVIWVCSLCHGRRHRKS